jgi:hypothetical protein
LQASVFNYTGRHQPSASSSSRTLHPFTPLPCVRACQVCQSQTRCSARMDI